MALIFIRPLDPPVTPGPVKFSWEAWYAKNKTRLSEKRAKRYREDAAYREAALQRSRQRKGKKVVPLSTDHHSVSFNDAAQTLGVTVWVLREWRRKDYFPEPHRRDGRLWFTPLQVQWLRTIQEFFVQHGARVTNATRPKLEQVTNLVYANWA